MNDSQYVYIVDAYSRFHRNKDVVFRFIYHDQWWAIRRVPLEWGVPQFEEKDMDDDYTKFHLYNTYEEAMEFVRKLRKGENYV